MKIVLVFQNEYFGRVPLNYGLNGSYKELSCIIEITLCLNSFPSNTLVRSAMSIVPVSSTTAEGKN